MKDFDKLPCSFLFHRKKELVSCPNPSQVAGKINTIMILIKLTQFNWNLNFINGSTQEKMQINIKICQVGIC